MNNKYFSEDIIGKIQKQQRESLKKIGDEVLEEAEKEAPVYTVHPEISEKEEIENNTTHWLRDILKSEIEKINNEITMKFHEEITKASEYECTCSNQELKEEDLLKTIEEMKKPINHGIREILVTKLAPDGHVTILFSRYLCMKKDIYNEFIKTDPANGQCYFLNSYADVPIYEGNEADERFIKYFEEGLRLLEEAEK